MPLCASGTPQLPIRLALTAARIGLSWIGPLFLNAAVLVVNLDGYGLRITSRYPRRVSDRLILARSPRSPHGPSPAFTDPLIVLLDDIDPLHDPPGLPSITTSVPEYLLTNRYPGLAQWSAPRRASLTEAHPGTKVDGSTSFPKTGELGTGLVEGGPQPYVAGESAARTLGLLRLLGRLHLDVAE